MRHRNAQSAQCEQVSKHSIQYTPADRPKSDLYRDALPLINSGRLALLDHSKSIAQLTALERKTSGAGRDSIDHPPGGRDDLANVVCGVAVQLAAVSALDCKAAGLTSTVTW